MRWAFPIVDRQLSSLYLVSGAGSWSVKFSGSSTNWFYEGDGQAKVAVDEHGKYTVSGGANTITGDM